MHVCVQLAGDVVIAGEVLLVGVTFGDKGKWSGIADPLLSTPDTEKHNHVLQLDPARYHDNLEKTAQ